jgi:hypothetical protein
MALVPPPATAIMLKKKANINGISIMPLMLRLLLVYFTTANVAFISIFYGSITFLLAKVIGVLPILAVYVAAYPD